MEACEPASGRPENCIAQPDPGDSLPVPAEAEEGVPPSFGTSSASTWQSSSSSHKQPELEPEPEQGLGHLAVEPIAGSTEVQRVVQRTTELVRGQKTITYTRVKRALVEEFGEAAFGEAAEEVKQMLKIAEDVRVSTNSLCISFLALTVACPLAVGDVSASEASSWGGSVVIVRYHAPNPVVLNCAKTCSGDFVSQGCRSCATFSCSVIRDSRSRARVEMGSLDWR